MCLEEEVGRNRGGKDHPLLRSRGGEELKPPRHLKLVAVSLFPDSPVVEVPPRTCRY